ncbi:GH20980 [Drosophila grimshawi]|uniref:GH20980 n=1 Tax=Drosophila grimshawi TaxID=7222 RepID=B4J4T1_DROGR|nr:GH20980 [Drosophila grimshawi]
MDPRGLIVETTELTVNATDMYKISLTQTITFMSLISVMFFCSFLGNVSSLYVNSRRKLRPFFRACLISLACSDLIYSINFFINNISYFSAEYLEIWTLGSFMCNFVPLVNAATILLSSMVLVVIALDRYMVLRRAAKGVWNPDCKFCIICIGGIWLTCIVTAVPLVTIYRAFAVQISTEDEVFTATMCLGKRSQVRIYNIVCLALIFAPCLVAFVFLNVTIAKQLWQRRHQQRNRPEQEQEQPERQDEARYVYLLSKPETAYAMMTAFSVAASFDMSGTAAVAPSQLQKLELPEKLSPAAVARLARHRRMVHVVILMMGIFICLRLPAWVFLLMRLYGSFSSSISYLFYFSLGVLNLMSCALNPLFYTFPTQAINLLSRLRETLGCGTKSQQESDVAMPKDSCKQHKRCFCFGLQVKWRCYLKSEQPANSVQVASPVVVDSLPPSTGFKGDIFTIYSEHSLQSTAAIESSAKSS